MARGIDYRDKEDVLKAFEFSGKSRWAIFAGNEIVTSSSGADSLDQYLQLIEGQDHTRQTFTLKVYDDGDGSITNKTANAGSFNFNLNQDIQTTTDPKTGIMVIDRSQRAPAGNNSQYVDLLAKIVELERSLLTERHNHALAQLNDKFDRAIAGLNNATPEPEKPWEKALNAFVEDPNKLTNFLGGIKNLFIPSGSNRPDEDYFRTPEAGIAGTNNTEEETMPTETTNAAPAAAEEQELTEEQENALNDKIDDSLDSLADRLGLPATQQVIGAIAAMPDDQLGHWVVQQQHMATLAMRLKPEVLTKMISTVAGMDDKNLKKLLSHLD